MLLYRKLQKGEVSYINVNHHRDFIHVEDLITGIKVIYDNFWTLLPKGRVRDIGTGHTTPVEQVAKVMGYEGEYHYENPKGERIKTCADVEYLLQLGWTPKHNVLNQ